MTLLRKTVGGPRFGKDRDYRGKSRPERNQTPPSRLKEAERPLGAANAVSLGLMVSALLLEEALRIQRRHAAGARRGDGLAVDVVLHIARCEDARHAGHRCEAAEAGARDDVAVLH